MAVVQAEHFDIKHTQPYFVYFVKMNRLSIGCHWHYCDFIIWINGKHKQFQQSIGKHWNKIVAATSSKQYQKKFCNWLESTHIL